MAGVAATPMPAEAAAASDDARRFRDALARFPTGVAIVTTTDPAGHPVGLTCNSLNAVSLNPPLVSWALQLGSRNREAFDAAQGFAIHVLAAHQKELSDRFARRDLADRFHGIRWQTGSAGYPLIEDCVLTIECRKIAAHVLGDHVLFVGQACSMQPAGEEHSMVFYRGRYGSFTPAGRTAPPP